MSSIANNFKSDYSKAENIRFLSKVTTQSILWSQVPTENYTWIFVILPWNWYWCSGKSKCHAFSLDDSKLTDMFDQLVRIVKNIELYHILFFLCYFNYYINCDKKKRSKFDVEIMRKPLYTWEHNNISNSVKQPKEKISM